MILKWNRETFLVTFTLITILFGLFYFGNQYVIEPVREEADVLSLLVDEQETVLANYPPSEELRNEYENNYLETASYLPLGDDTSEALVTLEQLSARESVIVTSVSRMSDREAVEGLPASYVKNTYQAEVTSDSPGNLRQLIQQLMNEERIWNITSFGYDKISETEYTGTFTFELFFYTDSTE